MAPSTSVTPQSHQAAPWNEKLQQIPGCGQGPSREAGVLQRQRNLRSGRCRWLPGTSNQIVNQTSDSESQNLLGDKLGRKQLRAGEEDGTQSQALGLLGGGVDEGWPWPLRDQCWHLCRGIGTDTTGVPDNPGILCLPVPVSGGSWAQGLGSGMGLRRRLGR